MGPEGIFLVNSPITTFQQSLTHSAVWHLLACKTSVKQVLYIAEIGFWQIFKFQICILQVSGNNSKNSDASNSERQTIVAKGSTCW